MTSPQSNNSIECIDESDPAIDFCNLNVRLARPSDHRTPVNNPYAPPPRSRHLSPRALAQRFLNDPVTSTLHGFSRITSHFNGQGFNGQQFNAWDPHEEYDNVIDLITSRDSTAFEAKKEEAKEETFRPPPPALPSIPCTVPQSRLEPLISEEFDSDFQDKSNEVILERIFRGGMGDNDLRRRLWPLILGLTDDHRTTNWESLEKLYDHYENQWKSILPDQEDRFTAYRERKSIVERDVIRCDRTHPFYSLNGEESSQHLEQLRHLLMTYVMFDFDTGYVQGMTDLASPLLFVWEGDVKKAFWTFVKVMEYFVSVIFDTMTFDL